MHATDIIALKTDDVYDNNNIINDKWTWGPSVSRRVHSPNDTSASCEEL